MKGTNKRMKWTNKRMKGTNKRTKEKERRSSDVYYLHFSNAKATLLEFISAFSQNKMYSQ